MAAPTRSTNDAAASHRRLVKPSPRTVVVPRCATPSVGLWQTMPPKGRARRRNRRRSVPGQASRGRARWRREARKRIHPTHRAANRPRGAWAKDTPRHTKPCEQAISQSIPSGQCGSLADRLQPCETTDSRTAEGSRSRPTHHPRRALNPAFFAGAGGRDHGPCRHGTPRP